MYSPSIQKLISALTKLPGVGPRTAERFVFYLLKSGKKNVAELTLSLTQLIKNTKSCKTCWDFSDSDTCPICSNQKRNQNIICVVSEPQDLHVFERLGQHNGVYHILRGTIKPDDEIQNKQLKIPELLDRIKNKTDLEIILALNPDMNGEMTMMFLEKKIKEINPDIKVTRLARGLPMGSDLQYADEITLGSALKNRT